MCFVRISFQYTDQFKNLIYKHIPQLLKFGVLCRLLAIMTVVHRYVGQLFVMQVACDHDGNIQVPTTLEESSPHSIIIYYIY